MFERKILFLVAMGGFLAQASKISLTDNIQSNLGEHELKGERNGHANRSEEALRLVPIIYLFSTSVSDSSRGFFQSRTEERNQNGQVKGEYSYMDGFYKVKVVYTAGPNGFRVIRQERVPLKKIKPTSTIKPH